MTSLTIGELHARQLAAWAGFEAAESRLQALPTVCPERPEWAAIKQACAKEHTRLFRQLTALRREAYVARYAA